MITKIETTGFNIRNFDINFKARKETTDGAKNDGTPRFSPAPNSDTFTFQGKKPGNIGAEDFPKEIGISLLGTIYDKAQEAIDEVCALYKNGEYYSEDGSRVQILDLTYNNSQIMYEHSADIEITRKSTFKHGKLQEIRMPMEKDGQKARVMIIKPFEDGKTLKLFEIKYGDKSGEGTIETMITFDKKGRISSFTG